jgi:hypothetical protein
VWDILLHCCDVAVAGSANPAAAAAAGSSAAAAAAGGGTTAAAAAAAGTQSYKLLSMLPVDLLARYNQVESDNQGVCLLPTGCMEAVALIRVWLQ